MRAIFPPGLVIARQEFRFTAKATRGVPQNGQAVGFDEPRISWRASPSRFNFNKGSILIRRDTQILGLLLLIGAIAISGCTFFGKPVGDDLVKADTLEQEIAGYQGWQTPGWVEGFQESVHPLPAYVKYYVNDKGMSDIDNPPNGSIFVKEQFDEDKQFIGLTVMKKVDGYDPGNGDWYWAIADTDAQVTHAGRLNSAWTSNCIDCHKKGDGGGDLLFVND